MSGAPFLDRARSHSTATRAVGARAAAVVARAACVVAAIFGMHAVPAFAGGTVGAAAPALATSAAAAPAATRGAKESPPPLGTPRDFALPEKAELTLPNGLGVTFVPFGTVPKATILVVVRTGNIDDGELTGLADFVTDLLKEGAGGRSAAEIARYAAEMGGSLDVGASADQTSVGLDVLSERAADAVALAADVLRRPALPESEVERLKANALRQVAVARSQPQAIAGEAYAKLIWGAHPYGRALPAEKDIAAYSAEAARRFVAENFGAARTHVYVGGRFDRAAVERAIVAAFGDWAAGKPPTRNVPTGSRVQRVQLIDRPDSEQSTIMLGLPAVDPTSPDYVKLVVTNTLLGGGLISRLDQNLREQKGYTYGVASRITPNYRAGLWTVSADVNSPDTVASLREIFRELARLRAEPPPADELRRIQNYRAGTFVIGASSRTGLLGQLSFLDLHDLPDEWLRDYVKNVYAVAPADLSATAKQHLDPGAMTLVVVGDMKKLGSAIRALPELRGAAAP